jgi:hypothetical protein
MRRLAEQTRAKRIQMVCVRTIPVNIVSDKNVFIYRIIRSKSIKNKYISYTKIFYTTVVLCIEPNTEADIDIIARCIIDNIDFISQEFV